MSEWAIQHPVTRACGNIRLSVFDEPCLENFEEKPMTQETDNKQTVDAARELTCPNCKSRLSREDDEHCCDCVRNAAQTAQLTQERDDLKAVLKECSDKWNGMGNDRCSVCGYGYRSSDGKGNVLNNCDNAECLSHRIAAALGAGGER